MMLIATCALAAALATPAPGAQTTQTVTVTPVTQSKTQTSDAEPRQLPIRIVQGFGGTFVSYLDEDAVLPVWPPHAEKARQVASADACPAPKP